MSQLITIGGEKFSANVRVSQTTSFAAISEPSQINPVLNATWEMIADDSAKRPAKGDTLIASDGTEWCVQKVTTITHRGVWQCQTYTAMTDFLPYDTMNILRLFAAVPETCAAGAITGTPTIAWRRVRTNLSAKLICDAVLSQNKRETSGDEKKLRAYFRDHVPMQKHDLVELPDGRQYKIARTRKSQHTHGWTELFLTIKTDPVVIR